MKTTSTRVIISLLLAVSTWVVAHGLTRPDPEHGPLAPLKHAAGDVRYTKLVVAGETLEKGIYDPCIAYTPDGSIGWLAYSSVTGNGNLIDGKLSLGEYISTHLACTTDGGATWTLVKVLNVSSDGTCEMPDGGKLQGVWRYEVPSLVCDTGDPDTSRRWKLIAHRYFWERERDSHQTHAWIVLRTAADPAGEWSEEVPLFGAGKNPPSPYHKTKVDVNALEASLRNNVVYTEPGALVHEGRLHLSLTALHPQLGLGGIGAGKTIILLSSGDHGNSWKLSGTLLTAKDANDFGYDYFDGTALVADGGRVFLLAVPGGRHWMHDGCVAFEVASLADGKLHRDPTGRLSVANNIAPQRSILSGPGAGQATFHTANVNGGLLMAQFNLKTYPEVFQIYRVPSRPALEPPNCVPVATHPERAIPFQSGERKPAPKQTIKD